MLVLSLIAFPSIILYLTKNVGPITSYLLFTLLTLAQAVIASYPKNDIGDHAGFLILYFAAIKVLGVSAFSLFYRDIEDHLREGWAISSTVAILLSLPLVELVSWAAMPFIWLWCIIFSRLWLNRLVIAASRPDLNGSFIKGTIFVYIGIGLKILGLFRIRVRSLE